MARPLQTGLNYFPLDVTIDQDDKIALIESDFDIEGFAVIIKLLMKIYSEGYFYHWGEKEQKLFSRKIGVEVSLVTAIADAGLRWGLFSQSLFDDYGILTSRGLQKRYFEAVSRRKDVHVIQEYLLLSAQEKEEYSNLNIVSLYLENTIDLIDEGPYFDSAELMSTLTTQRKEKESRVKESKSSSESEKGTSNSDDDILTVLDEYTSKIESPTKEVERQLNNWLMVFDGAVIIEAITRTKLNGKSFSYLNAILTDFKRRHVQSVNDITAYDDSFKHRQQGHKKQQVRKESLPQWTASDNDDQPVDATTNERLKASLERIREKK